MPTIDHPGAMITELRVVQTLFGPTKVHEFGSQEFLVIPQLPGAARLVPYLENGLVSGVFVVDSARATTSPQGQHYPVTESIPFFLLDDPARQELLETAAQLSISLQFPAEHDLTGQVKEELAQAEVLWRNRADNPFTLAAFIAAIRSVKASEQFHDLYLITAQGGQRFIMAVEQLIESVIDLHPHFIMLYAPDAVKVSFRQSKNTWIAPFGRGPRST